ncbi:MAG: HigA family addiction module antitoxin [Arhodomonas sp.]|nr:HigA family addiction module antitoxin [Arhodomonas sp.]
MSTERIGPIHAGEHLKEFLEEYDLSEYRLARSIHVPPRRINEIVKGERGITADTALRLGRFFGMSPQYWMHLQDRFELERTTAERGARIDTEVTPLRA